MAIQSVVSVTQSQAYASPGTQGNEVAGETRAAGSAAQASVAVAAQTPLASPPQAVSAQQVTEAADNINKVLKSLTSSSLQFAVDHDTGRTVVRIVDVQTKEVIRQIPSEEAVLIAKSIDKLQGLLIRQKA